MDWDRIRDLRADVGEDDLGGIIALFLEETDAVVAQLAAYRSAGELRSDLHFLKGSALNIGMASFAQACQAAEEQLSCDNGSVDIDLILGLYVQSREALVSGLTKLAA